jgi:hypothetical protein
MSDTPETDASRGYALSSHYGRLEGSYLQMDRSGPFVHAEVARKLERERDEAIRQRNETNESSKYAVDYAMRERDEARELAQQMSESNQVLQAEVRDYRKTAAKTPLSNNEMHLNLVLQEVAKLAKTLKEERDEALDRLSQFEIVAVEKCQTTPSQK